MATMKVTRTLREAPNGTPMDALAPAGVKVEILDNKEVEGAGKWIKVRLVAAIDTPEGWVSADAVDAAGVLPAAPIDKALFAKECWRQALYTGTNAHYLAAVAELRSHIRTGTDAGKTAPFDITQAEWDTTIKDKDFELDFLAGDIDNWRLQCAVFAVMTLRTLEGLMVGANKDKRPSAVDLYIAQLGSPALDATARADLVLKMKEALDATRAAILSAGADVLVDPSAPTTPTNPSAAQFNSAGVPAGREDVAKLIISKFQAAGYGPIQQIAAVANAIAESALDPNAEVNNSLEHSVGLFQLNIGAGLGRGHSAAQLKDPATNIAIIIAETQKFDAFKNASSLFDAVDVFVRKVERPANPGSQVQKRAKIAERLKGTQALLA
jgi:tail lysozyme